MSRNFQHLYKEKSRKNERSHRTNVLVELRNERRDDLLQRKRLEPKQTDQPPTNYDNATIMNAIKLCENDNNEDRAKGILILRSAIYSDISKSEHIVATAQFVLLIFNLLNTTQNEEIQFDAACVLANLTIKYKNVRVLLTNEETIKVLLNYLNPINARLCETILLTLANIILENPNAIGILTHNNIWDIIQQILSTNPPVHIIKNVSYFLMNFTSKSVIKYSVNPQIVALILPIFNHLIRSTDDKTLSNVLWSIASVNDTSVDNIMLITKSGILDTCKQLLMSSNVIDILHASMRVFGNIVTNEDDITQYVINMGLLPIISNFLTNESPLIQKECLWFISNVAAGNVEQMTLILEGNVINLVMNRLINGTKIVVREALWVLSNILYVGKPSQILILMKLSLIDHVCNVLHNSKDPEIIFLCMEIFQFAYDNSGSAWGIITTQIEIHGGLEELDALQNHPNVKISETASFILEQYVVSNSSQLPEFEADENIDGMDGNSFEF